MTHFNTSSLKFKETRSFKGKQGRFKLRLGSTPYLLSEMTVLISGQVLRGLYLIAYLAHLTL